MSLIPRVVAQEIRRPKDKIARLPRFALFRSGEEVGQVVKVGSVHSMNLFRLEMVAPGT